MCKISPVLLSQASKETPHPSECGVSSGYERKVAGLIDLAD
ncbi:Hypothetical protein, conserved [Brucella abortus str. 2308 A]|uniref:Uncharacterized protein n=6 Tax=Brucella TaxID=234 RepID=Q578B5_BRUAB|nr:hypothetical protein BRA0617 [Brucella suis 1330]AAX76019.1 hypothetical protein BruAb2_0608 [Brucella abortus bv. 1 str. 9-941]ACD74077.1 hypothetical protein BAbS19_II05820 [Brucella abortus S19]ACO02420.1 Hypothetical protein, conserved [Brucella melitensis ATCC 23457]ACU49741.1 hypothetical protein BMI_II613 [Brucella microti CCM 4915]AEK56098.1 hypothetical protein BPI_II671 [Brucella pinnipedialis B2/94]AEU07754.1 hypothetical protein BSVBI22_B0611 [Brucella suis VBI22]AHN48351.1 hy